MKLITYYGWALLAFTLAGSCLIASNQTKRPLLDEEAGDHAGGEEASLTVKQLIQATKAEQAYPLRCGLCAVMGGDVFTLPKQFRAHLIKSHKEDLKIAGLRPENFYEPCTPVAAPAGDEAGGTSLLDMLAICATAELVGEEGSAAVQASTKTSPLKKKRVVASPAPRRGRPPQSSPPAMAKQPAQRFFPPAVSSPAPTNLMPPVAAKASEWDIAGMVALERIKARKLPVISTFIAKERSKYLTDPDHIRVFLDYVQYVLYELEFEPVMPAREEEIKLWKKAVQDRYRNYGLYDFLASVISQLEKCDVKARKFKPHCLEVKRLLEDILKHAAPIVEVEDEIEEEVEDVAAPAKKAAPEPAEDHPGPLQLPAVGRSLYTAATAVPASSSAAATSASLDMAAPLQDLFEAMVGNALRSIARPAILAPELRALPLQQGINALIIKATEVDMYGYMLDNRFIAEAAAEMGDEISLEGDWGYLYVLGGIAASLVDSTTPPAQRKKLLASWEEYTQLCSSQEVVDIFVSEVIAALLSPASMVDSLDKKLAKELKRLGHSARLRIAKQKRFAWGAAEDFSAATTVSTSAAASAAEQNVVDLTGEEEALSAEKWDPFKGLV